MARTSVIAILMLASTGSGAAAQVATAETAMDRYRDVFTPVDRADCPRSAGDDILVCGRSGRPDPNRLPLPVAPLPGARTGGEPPDQLAAAEVGSEPCTTIGPNGGCGGYIPILPFALWVGKAVVKAVREAEE
jgi:hypothetical protein